MFDHIHDMLSASNFIPHGHCFLWIPSLLWLHVGSDTLIGLAYVGIACLLYVLVRTIRLPFSPVFIAFGLFIGLCGLTHFMQVWTVWNPTYWASGYLKASTAMASVATAFGLLYVRPQIEEVVYAARLSEERRNRLESTNAELEKLNERIKELDQIKSQFFANVSHELRTPLALIIGPADQLLQDRNLSREQRRQITSITRNAKLLVNQVNDLLDVSKLEAGGMSMRYASLDLAPWFRLIASHFEVAAEQRNIRFAVSAPGHMPAQVDPDLLQRVVINLLSNAFKFTQAGGEINATLSSAHEHIALSVSDTGPGVRPDQRAVIFERYRQGEGGPARLHGGTGIGLALVRDFVDLHHGQVDVGETPGGGAIFTVTLPRHAPAGTVVEESPDSMGVATRASLEGVLQELEAESTQEQETASPMDPGRARVLVVEDNREMREFVTGILAGHYTVVTAADGEQGIEQARALRPDLIITDMMMPRVSGEQLVRTLRQEAVFDSTPILLLSARTDEALRVRLLANGAQDFLNKPFLPAELLARAANLVSVKRAGDTLRGDLTSLTTDLEVLAQEIAVKNRSLQVARDVTEVARQQAEQASQAKSAFLGMISHEFRTPLSTIQMNVQLLLRKQADALSAASLSRIARLGSASRQMQALIESLLEFTRVESGRMPVRSEAVDVTALARELVEEHRHTLSQVSDAVTIALDTPRVPIPPLQSDPRLIKVILNNLLSNAIKFTEQGTVTVGVESTGPGACLRVQDTGPGIPEDALELIFQPFEQLEPVRRKSLPGIGLGLALVKQLVGYLGGEVTVRSEVGQGSVFTVTLPRQRPRDATDESTGTGHSA